MYKYKNIDKGVASRKAYWAYAPDEIQVSGFLPLTKKCTGGIILCPSGAVLPLMKNFCIIIYPHQKKLSTLVEKKPGHASIY